MSDLDKLMKSVEEINTKVNSIKPQSELLTQTGFTELKEYKGEFKSAPKNWFFVLERFGTTFLLLFVTSIQSGVSIKQSALISSVSVLREIKSFFTNPGG